MRYLEQSIHRTETSPPEPLPGRPEQSANSAGIVCAADLWTRTERFLVLGSEDGTYSVRERPLTIGKAVALREALRQDGLRVVRLIVEIAASGRAPGNDPALFALALAASPGYADAVVNAAALTALPLVARTGAHLAAFAACIGNLRGWGRGLRSAVARWYLEMPVADLASQMLKHQNRRGWRHRDLLRLAHPKPDTLARRMLFRWATDEDMPVESLAPELPQVYAFERARRAASESEMVRLIEDYRLTQEMIPDEWKNAPAVWEALLEQMSYTSMVRNLAKMTAIGLIAPQSWTTALITTRLVDGRRITKSRLHPVALLAALLAYKLGRGVKGSLTWTPVAQVIDALDEAVDQAFGNVEPIGRRIVLALDASSSMQGTVATGMPYLSAAMGSAALAMAFVRREPNARILAFHDRVWPVDITAKDRLDRAVSAIIREPRATDASLPMRYAQEQGWDIDAFILLTDTETWSGGQHPVPALTRYRQATGLPAKLAVAAMAANRYAITDPRDAHQLDVAGFDSSVPAVIAGFVNR